MKAVEIIVRRTRKPSRCVQCNREIPVGTMVHAVPGDDGRPRAAHTSCDLDRADRAWRERLREREKFARDAANHEFGCAKARRA